MRRYFFQIQSEHGRNEDRGGIPLPNRGVAMLHAVAMCAEIGCSGGFDLGFAVIVRNENGAVIGRVSVVVATASLEGRDA